MTVDDREELTNKGSRIQGVEGSSEVTMNHEPSVINSPVFLRLTSW